MQFEAYFPLLCPWSCYLRTRGDGERWTGNPDATPCALDLHGRAQFATVFEAQGSEHLHGPLAAVRGVSQLALAALLMEEQLQKDLQIQPQGFALDLGLRRRLVWWSVGFLCYLARQEPARSSKRVIGQRMILCVFCLHHLLSVRSKVCSTEHSLMLGSDFAMIQAVLQMRRMRSLMPKG